MIDITRNEKCVKLSFLCRIPWLGERIFTFDWNCSDDVYAGLLAQHLKEHLATGVETIRRESYEKGWKDAKAHRRKEDWFSPRL